MANAGGSATLSEGRSLNNEEFLKCCCGGLRGVHCSAREIVKLKSDTLRPLYVLPVVFFFNIFYFTFVYYRMQGAVSNIL